MIWSWILGRIIQPFLPYILGGLLALAAVGTIGGYIKGRMDASAKCHDAELRVQIATMQRDMAAWQSADKIEKMLQHDIERDNADLQQKVQDYETDLAKRPDNRCILSPADAAVYDGLSVKRKR
jgi:hypothetical protein